MPPKTMESPSETQVANFEVPLSAETMQTVRWMCTHEAKLMTVLFLDTQSNFIGPDRMDVDFREFVGSEAEHPPGKRKPFAYCDKSLKQGKIVEQGVPQGGRGGKTGYALIEDSDHYVALAGELLKWSLEYPDISLQTILSVPQSPSGVSAQTHRMGVLLELLTSPKEHVPLTDVLGVDFSKVDRAGYDNIESAISGAANKMESEGFLSIDRVIEENDREFEILDPNYPNGYGRRLRSLAVEGIYAFMQARTEAGQFSFTQEECLRFVTTWALQQDPDIDLAHIRDRLSTTLNGNTGQSDDGSDSLIPGLRPIGSFNDGYRTRLHVVGEYEEALTKLVNIFINYDTRDAEGGNEVTQIGAEGDTVAQDDQIKKSSFVEKGLQAAQEIIEDDRLKGMLIDKAHRFSRAENKQSKAETYQVLMAIITDAGMQLTSSEVYARYVARTERQIEERTVATYLGELVTKKALVAEMRRRDATLRFMHKFYGITETA